MSGQKGPVEPKKESYGPALLETMYTVSCERGGDKPPKQVFMQQFLGGMNEELRVTLGCVSTNKVEYLEKASSWWDKRQALGPPALPEIVRTLGMVSFEDEFSPDSLRRMLGSIHPSLSKLGLDVRPVADRSGRRNANLAVVSSDFIVPPSEGDLVKISSCVAGGFVEGVSSMMPHERDHIVPWQMILPRRSLKIEAACGEPSYYIGKGFRFDPASRREFDNESEGARLRGEKPKRGSNMYEVFDEAGIRHAVERPLAMYMGMNCQNAAGEIGGMALAIMRGIRDRTKPQDPIHIRVDDPIAIVRFDSVRSPAGVVQGGTITRASDEGPRGDELMNLINRRYIGRLMCENQSVRDFVVDGSLRPIEHVLSQLRGPIPARLPPGMRREDLVRFRDTLAGFQKEVSACEKSMGLDKAVRVVAIGEVLDTLKIPSVQYPELFRPGIIPGSMSNAWRSELESIYRLAGLANRHVLEHGMIHWQTYSGNLRYHEREGGVDLTICDWDRSRDVVGMTYKQTIGFVLQSMDNMLGLAKSSQERGIVGLVKPDFVRACLEGFQMKVPGWGEKSEPVPRELMEAAVSAASSIPPEYGGGVHQTELSLLVDASVHHPAADIGHPFVEFVRSVYTPEKHGRIQKG
ncbi:MAG: hypothetical protein V1875_07105 [Candidatus Altiarchaeota archaeon]